MKVALVFWGLTRSLKYTIKSIEKFVFDPLRAHDIEYVVFLHTYVVKGTYTNTRAHERNVRLDPEEYRLLNPDFVQVDQKDDVVKKLDMVAYRSKGDPWRNKFESLNNFVLALYSRKEATKMVMSYHASNPFDYVVFLRPDVEYLVPLDVNFFTLVHENTVAVPNFHRYSEKNDFNDRFAITHHSNFQRYGMLFDDLLDYSQRFQPHSETMHVRVLQRYGIRPVLVNFFFNRVRATGAKSPDCPPEFLRRFQKSG